MYLLHFFFVLIKFAYWNQVYEAWEAGDCKVKLDEDMHEYVRIATEHDARQPFIKDELIEAINLYSCVTFRQLSGHINHWCQYSCISNWLHSHHTFSIYAKNIKPGLTPESQIKQVEFSRRVQQRWGLTTAQKILWIHCDEKWFHGIVPRTNGKACPELGIDTQSHSAHHKKHIAKVMEHCCVGYLFDGDVEAGGDGFLISLDRYASYKMPLRNNYHSSRDEEATGKLKFKGNELKKHAAGVIPYLVDCNVTGSDEGTATKPCFPLRKLWEFTLIPAIAQLLEEGGACAGAQVVVQQDNAGPHIEVGYRLWMQHIFDELGWLYEPQAPQGTLIQHVAYILISTDASTYWQRLSLVPCLPTLGPYTKVLDLYLFPSMSHRHSAILQRQSNKELPLDRIWKEVESVWNDTVSAEVARL